MRSKYNERKKVVSVEAIELPDEWLQGECNDSLISLLEVTDIREKWNECLEDLGNVRDSIDGCLPQEAAAYRDAVEKMYKAYHIGTYFRRNGDINKQKIQYISKEQYDLLCEIREKYEECLWLLKEKEDEWYDISAYNV